MPTNIQYALMAGAAYISSRVDKNKFPAPDGWDAFGHRSLKENGFEAISFTDGNEVVISFAGTYFKDGYDKATDIALSLGSADHLDQLFEAAKYYLEVKAQYPPGTKITFTGHSLGGGLAALLGVFFNVPAVTFDQAPFSASATRLMSLRIQYYLLDLKDANNQPVNTEDDLRSLAPELFSIDSDATLQARATNVTGFIVQGEVLEHWPVNAWDRIGYMAEDGYLNHGATGVSGTWGKRGQVFAWLLAQ